MYGVLCTLVEVCTPSYMFSTWMYSLRSSMYGVLTYTSPKLQVLNYLLVRGNPREEPSSIDGCLMIFSSSLRVTAFPTRMMKEKGSRVDFGISDGGSVPSSVGTRQVIFDACRVTEPCGKSIGIDEDNQYQVLRICSGCSAQILYSVHVWL